MTAQTTAASLPTSRLRLAYPMSLGVFDAYEDAQRAVDHLADHEFPVADVMIVGTDLKQIERVTGRLTWGSVIAGGALSGMWLGLFIGVILSLFDEGPILAILLSTVLTGAVFGTVWAAIGYAVTRGRRDFTSVSQVVATRYEVLTEHKHAAMGRELLAKLDPRAAAQERIRAAQEAARPQQSGGPGQPRV